MIKIDTLKKTYSVTSREYYRALRGVSLVLPDTGLVSILGPSGCGKTTLLNILSLLDTPTSGSIYYNGVNIADLDEKQKDQFRHYTIGFVYQEYNLLEHLNVFDNVKIAFDIGSTVNKEEENQIVNDLLLKLNIFHLRRRMPNTLSGGEKQRVAIARSLANNPSVILADEPTGALDSKTSVEVMNILKELSKDRLVLIVTHNNHLAMEYSDRVVELADGRIVSDSAPLTEAEFTTPKPINSQKRFGSIFKLALRRLKHKKARYGFLVAINTLAILTASIASGALLGSKRFSTQLQKDTLKSFPVTVSSVYIGTGSSFMTSDAPLYPGDGNVHRIDNDSSSVGVNSITTDYVNYLTTEFQKHNVDLECLTLRKGLAPTILMEGESNIVAFEASDITTFTGFDSLLKDAGNYFRPLYGGRDQLMETYDLVYGKLPNPKNPNELIVVLDKYESFPTYMLDLLGLKGDKIPFKTFQQKKFKFVNHDEYYGNPMSSGVETTANFIKDNDTLKREGKQADEIQGLLLEAITAYQDGGPDNIAIMNEKLATVSSYFAEQKHTLSYFRKPSGIQQLFNDPTVGHEMVITGFVRPKKTQFFPYLSAGIYYSKEYNDLFLQENHASRFAEEYSKHISFTRGAVDTLATPDTYNIIGNNADKEEKANAGDINGTYAHILNRKLYGVDESIYQLEIMAKSFDMKERAVKVMKRWNMNHEDIERISFSDVGGAIINMIDKYVGLLLAVLVAVIVVVVAFSILVTSLLAVLEIKGRVREIGLYRSLGSTRGYVRTLFLVEQGIVGLAAGFLGIGLALALIPLINKFIESAVAVAVISNFAYLTWWIAIIIPIIALIISILSCIIPAIKTTRQNPSTALKEL